MGKQWFVKQLGKVSAPMSGSELKQLANDGGVYEGAEVSNYHDGPFHPANKVKGLKISHPPVVAEVIAMPPPSFPIVKALLIAIVVGGIFVGAMALLSSGAKRAQEDRPKLASVNKPPGIATESPNDAQAKIEKPKQDSDADEVENPTVAEWRTWTDKRKFAYCEQVASVTKEADVAALELFRELNNGLDGDEFPELPLNQFAAACAALMTNQPIGKFKGSGDEHTATFVVGKRRHLPITWIKTGGSMLTASIHHSTDGKIVEVGVVSSYSDDTKIAGHRNLWLDPGVYYLDVQSTANWTITVFKSQDQLARAVEEGRKAVSESIKKETAETPRKKSVSPRTSRPRTVSQPRRGQPRGARFGPTFQVLKFPESSERRWKSDKNELVHRSARLTEVRMNQDGTIFDFMLSDEEDSKRFKLDEVGKRDRAYVVEQVAEMTK